MFTVEGIYINKDFVNEIIFDEKDIKDNNVTKYQVLVEEELMEIKKEEINFSIFIIVPGYRIIETIQEELEITFNYKDEILKFEQERGVRYHLNRDNIKNAKIINSQYLRIIMSDNEVLWFKGFPENFKGFLSKLSA